MRLHGAYDTIPTAGVLDHVCWPYRTAAERLELAVHWLAEGAAAGQRPVYVGTDTADAVRTRLENAFAGAAPALLAFGPGDLYDLSGPIDADWQQARYAAAVDEALDAGFSGVRVFADITPLIADPAWHDSHARWEHRADRWIAAGAPLTPLCAFDMTAVGTPRTICALHPVRRDGVGATFGLWASADGLHLDGEIDTFALDVLDAVLDVAVGGEPEPIDLSWVTFLDGRSASALQRGATEGRWTLVNPSSPVRRVWQLTGVGEGEPS